MDLGVKKIPVLTTSLEMSEPPDYSKLRSNENLVIVRAENPTIEFYKFLFVTLGGEWGWTSRLLLTTPDLIKIINDEDVEIYVLYIKGVPAGFYELNKKITNEIKLEYFGLFKEFFGKKLGEPFLISAIKKAWSYKPKRFWLNTCEFDHEAALNLYKKVGFHVIEQKIELEIYPTDFIDKMINKNMSLLQKGCIVIPANAGIS